MPATTLIYFKDGNGTAPVLEWLEELGQQNRAAYAKCIARVNLLQTSGHELKRPIAAPLSNGIHELRLNQGRVNYRLLYFFHGRNVAILANACTKEDEVPEVEISRALERKIAFEADPVKHTYTEEQ